MAEQAKDDQDPRFDHFKNVILQVMDIDSGPWDELIWKEDNQTIVKDFLDSPSTPMLLAYFDHNEKLKLSLEIPLRPPMPENVAYFLKQNIPVSSSNYKQEIMCGNINNAPLKLYQKLFENIFLPIYCNPQNNKRWPEEISQDIALHFLDFEKTVTYHLGLAEGKTVLVIPDTAKMIKNYDINKISCENTDWALRNILNSISEMVDGWIPIVREFLDVTSEQILAKINQGPETEIEFWMSRKNNLNFIHQQLNEPSVKMMLLALEKTNNCHFPLLKNLLQEVAEGLAEAFEISTSLTSMEEQLQSLEKCQLPELLDVIPTAMKTVTSSWMESKYFNSMPSRISVLVQKMSNLLIEKVHLFLQPLSLFKEKREEMKSRVKKSTEVVSLFIKSYYDCREQSKTLSGDRKTYPWEFPDIRVFENFEKFIQRLDEINEIFEAADIYLSIPEHKIPGIQQTSYRTRLENLYNLFSENYLVFVESSYNPLDLNSKAFIEDYSNFCLKLKELDRKLGITLGQACITCFPTEEAFKLMNMLQDLITRPIANVEFKKLISSMVTNIYLELIAAKENYVHLVGYTEEKEDPVTYKNLPKMSGILQWANDLQKKLNAPINSVKQIKKFFNDLDDDHVIFKLYKEIEECLVMFQNTVSGRWKETLKDIEQKLNQPLFIDDAERHFTLTLDLQVTNVIEEIRYLKLLKKDNLLTQEAILFNEKAGNLLQTRSLMASIVRWFNDLAANLVKFELNLIEESWTEIVNLLKEGLSKKWNDDGIYEFSENLYCKLKVIFESINEAKENVKDTKDFITTWCNTPMFVRADPNSLIDFMVYQAPQVWETINAVKATKEKMQIVSQKNIDLFKSNENSDEWKGYITYLESIIEDGLKNVIKCSLEYLIENTDKRNKKMPPFYKISMNLSDDITFSPPLSRDKPHSFQQLFDTVIQKIYSPASEIKRMSDPNADYLESMEKCQLLSNLKQTLTSNVSSAVAQILSVSATFKTYSDLWLKTIEESLEDFVLYGPIIETAEALEEDELKEIEHTPLEEKPPTEEEFKHQILQFDLLSRKVEDIPFEIEIESWLILNVATFKERLLVIIRNWSSAYKKKLNELKTQGKLRKLEDDGDM